MLRRLQIIMLWQGPILTGNEQHFENNPLAKQNFHQSNQSVLFHQYKFSNYIISYQGDLLPSLFT